MEPIALRELTDLHGEHFIDQCYSRLLHRQADKTGKATFLSQLENGESKAVIIGRLLRSAEGRQIGEQVQGLWPRYFYHRLLAVPFLGRLLSILTYPIAAAKLSRDVRALQALNAELNDRSRSNSLDTHLPGILDAMSSVHEFVRETQIRMNAIDQTVGSHERTLQMKEVTDSAAYRKLSSEVEGLAAKSAAVQGELQSLKVAVDSLTEFQPSVKNLVQSHPAAARETTRQLIGLAATAERLSVRAEAMGKELKQMQELASTSTSQLMESFEERMQPVAQGLALANDRLESMSGIVDRMNDVENRVTNIEGRAQEIEGGLEQQIGLLKVCESAFPTLDYLSRRVEFVRREVLFETKYGRASSFAEQPDSVPRVIDQAAVEKARKEGLRLNVGCGHVPIAGYVNVDRRVLPNVQVKAEAHDLPFEAGEVVEIYCAHLLEHFPQEQLRRQVLPHWRALLAPAKGKLVAVVPDAEVMLNEYYRGTYPYESLREVLFGGQGCDSDFHLNMFVPEQLSMLLREAGFSEISWPTRGRRNGKCFEMVCEAW